MARTNIDIIVTVRDGASQPLQRVQSSIKNTGKAAKDVTADLWQFNKTLFSGIAFVNLFTRAFGGIRSAMDLGAPLDRITTQFERVLGPRGAFLKALHESTNSVTDEFSAIESALQLGQLGIAKSSQDAASMISKMAVAARMAGKDTAEGVKDLTQAISDGNIAKLQEYGIMRKYDPAYMALLATMNKAGGIYGATIVKQQQLALVMRQLTEHTKNNMFMFMSTGEVVTAMGKKFVDLRQHIGILLSTALRPLMEKLIPFVDRLSDTLYTLYRTDKQVIFLVKSVLALGGALAGVFATLGTLKLGIKLLAFAGVGFPALSAAILTLGATFVGLTKNADGVLEKFKVLGAVFKGVYELVTNLDPETGMSKISKSTKDLLEKYGLLGFTKTIAKVVSAIKAVVEDIYDVFKVTSDKINSIFGGMFDSLKNIFENFTSDWTTWWTSKAIDPIEKFKRAAFVILTPLFALFAMKGLRSLLAKIPVMGKFFGGGVGGVGPSGQASDPLFVVPMGAGFSGVLGAGKSGLGAGIGFLAQYLQGALTGLARQLGLGNFIKAVERLGLGSALWAFTKRIPIFGGLLKLFTSASSKLMTSITSVVPMLSGIPGMLMRTAPMFGTAIGFAGAAALGAAFGLIVNQILDKYTQGKTKEGFEGNIVERAFFDRFATEEQKKRYSDFEKFKASEDIAIINEFRKKAGQPLLTPEQESRVKNFNSKKTAAAAPSMPTDDLAIAAQLTEQMQQVSAEKAAEMKSAIEQAMKTQDGANGNFISPEEYSAFIAMFAETNENIKTIADNSKPSAQPRLTNRKY